MSAPSTTMNSAAKRRPSMLVRALRSRETGIVGALVVMMIALSILEPDFASLDNLLNDARNFSFVGIVVLGQAMVMITGGIDLSVGSVWGLAAVSSAALMSAGWGVIPACVAALAVSAAMGLFNGLCVTKLRMPPFVPTLATMSIARALALVITRGKAVDFFRPDGDWFFALDGGDTFGLPNPFLIFVALAIVVGIVLNRTVYGRQLYAVGGSERAARLTGLDVDNLKISVYVASSLVASLAGIIAVVVTNNEGAGAEGGAAFVKAMPNGGNLRRDHRGPLGRQPQRPHQGLQIEARRQLEGDLWVAVRLHDDTSAGVQIVQDILAKNPDLSGIFVSGGWPLMAPEAYQRALKAKAADLKDGKFAVVAFDTLPAEITNLKDGYVTALIGQKPYLMGVDAMQQLDALSKGEKVPPVTDTGVTVVDKTNVDKFADAQ